MKAFRFRCPACGPFDSALSGDTIQCRCGAIAKRVFGTFAVNRSSLKPEGHYDHVVGAYVENDRQFQSLLAQGIDRESEALSMDVKLAQCDPRDIDARAELHGIPKDVLEADTYFGEEAKAKGQPW